MKIVFITIFFITSQFVQDGSPTHHNLKNGVAIEGYDPVSYFLGEPAKGYKDINFSYRGVTYRFANSKNKEAFIANPKKYEPQYGGWCAYAMGKDGSKVDIDPETYKIKDGELYLFYNRFFTNTLNYWNEDEKKLKENADKNWSGLIKK